MKAGSGIRGLALALLALLVVPAHSAATDPAPPLAFAFRVPASHGYSIVAVAVSKRDDGRGGIFLFAERGRESASYAAPAQVSANGVEADLGSLGKVSLTVAPSGRERELRMRCGQGQPTSYEPPAYSGTFEFHGEGGYTDAVSAAPRDDTQFLASIVCPGFGRDEMIGGNLPGAALRLRGGTHGTRLHLQANENHPGARVRFQIETSEKRGVIRISRESTFWLRPGGLRFDPDLETATLAPPLPFAGHATFHRGAVPANRWTGDLTIDLPGRSNLPLTGSGLTATLEHACFQGEGAGTRADCGFR
ncbi:MAG TPA: hypothetical protein VHA54_02475 [Solirubrobacterales bacterium]|nr:hypothetical protein [Solirubrobacterales bacterium]